MNADQPVRQIAIEIPNAVSLFEKYGINYYLEGEKSLEQACVAGGIPFERVQLELREIESSQAAGYAQEPDWSRETMAAVIHYLLRVHHVKTRLMLDNIELALAQLTKGISGSSKLDLVREMFLRVDKELRNHMLEEEKTVFPYLVYAERELAKGTAVEKIPQKEKSFSDSIRNILFEHRFMDKGFHEIEKLVLLFKEDRTLASLEPLDKALNELKKDNQKHVHLENNILLKRTAQLGLMD